MAALSFEGIFEPIRALRVSHFDEIVRYQARRPLQMAAIAVFIRAVVANLKMIYVAWSVINLSLALVI